MILFGNYNHRDYDGGTDNINNHVAKQDKIDNNDVAVSLLSCY